MGEMRMTQRLRGIDNIRKAMERRVEEREDVMKSEAARMQEMQNQTPPSGEDSSVP